MNSYNIGLYGEQTEFQIRTEKKDVIVTPTTTHTHSLYPTYSLELS